MSKLDAADRALLESTRAAINRTLERCGDDGPIVKALGRKARGALSSRLKWANTAIAATLTAADDMGPADPATPDPDPTLN